MDEKIRNEQVTGSSPATSSIEIKAPEVFGGFFAVGGSSVFLADFDEP